LGNQMSYIERDYEKMICFYTLEDLK
jgi:hypothetical protein